jgi:hypothetical protein
MSALILALHNAWEWINPGVRTVLVFGGLTFLALVQAFGWTIPHSLTELQAEITLFVAFAAPAMIVFVQSKLLPAVVTWILGTFGLYRETAASSARDTLDVSYTGRWCAA